ARRGVRHGAGRARPAARPRAMSLPGLRELRHAVVDLVIVALVRAEDMDADLQPRRPVEGAGHDRGIVRAVALPEQRRAAGAAEAAAGRVARPVPGDVLAALHRQPVVPDIGGGVVMAGLPPALAAMAGDNVAQRA